MLILLLKVLLHKILYKKYLELLHKHKLLQHFFKNIKIIASSVGLLTKFFCTLLVTFFFIFRFR